MIHNVISNISPKRTIEFQAQTKPAVNNNKALSFQGLAQPEASLLQAYYLKPLNKTTTFTGPSQKADDNRSARTDGELFVRSVNRPEVFQDDNSRLTDEQAIRIAELVNNYQGPTPEIEHIGSGFLGKCFKVTLPADEHGIRKTVAVKVAKPDAEIRQRNQRETGFYQEAKALSLIPDSIQDAQHLISRFRFNDKCYLVTDLKKGVQLNKYDKNLSRQQLSNIIETLGALDRLGLINYDLNPGGIIVDENRVGIIDFEFSEQFDPYVDSYSPDGDLYNISSNFAFSRKSNISSFEVRALGEYLDKINDSEGSEAAREFVKTYLKALSSYHADMTEFYGKYLNEIRETNKYGYGSESHYYSGGKIKIFKASQAVNVEEALRNIFSNPSEEIIDIEMLRIQIKYTMIDYYLSRARLGTAEEKPGDPDKYGSIERVLERIRPLILEMEHKLTKMNKESNIYDNSKPAYINGYSKEDLNVYSENYLNYLGALTYKEFGKSLTDMVKENQLAA